MYTESKHQGNNGKVQELSGMKAVLLPNKTVELIEEAVIMNEDVVTETEVMQVLGISKKTLQNDVSSGKMPKEDYTTAYNGRRYYFLKKVLGLAHNIRRQSIKVVHHIKHHLNIP